MWGTHLHEKEGGSLGGGRDGIPIEVFHKAADEYSDIEHPHISNVINFTQPAKPIGVLYRTLKDG